MDIPFPPCKIENPPVKRDGLMAGYCVFCGGSLGKPYQEDLFHDECIKNSKESLLQKISDLVE